MMSALAKWKQAPGIVFGPINNGMALLDTQRNIYYALDGLGPALWGMLETPQQEDQLAERVARSFDIAEAAAMDDIREWLVAMRQFNLVQVLDGAEG